MDALDNSQADGHLTIDKAITNLRGEDLGLRVYAAWWLGRFRVDTPEAVDVLIAALDDEDDRTSAGGYPLRRNAARALGKLGCRRAVPALLQALRCSDYYVREAAAQSLGMLGDRACIPNLLALLDDQVSDTLPAPDPPHLIQPFDAILESLGMLEALEALPKVEPFTDHDVPRIRFSALRAMYQLTADSQQANQYGDRLTQNLRHDDLQLRRVVLSDLGAIGYLPAAEAIAQTLAENSLKLLSLQGLLEKQLQQNSLPDLNQDAVRVMALMDDLL